MARRPQRAQRWDGENGSKPSWPAPMA